MITSVEFMPPMLVVRSVYAATPSPVSMPPRQAAVLPAHASPPPMPAAATMFAFTITPTQRPSTPPEPSSTNTPPKFYSCFDEVNADNRFRSDDNPCFLPEGLSLEACF